MDMFNAAPSKMSQQKRSMFYPESKKKNNRTGVLRLNNNLSTGKGGSLLIGNNLIHDNQHAPFLGKQHMRTTAYL